MQALKALFSKLFTSSPKPEPNTLQAFPVGAGGVKCPVLEEYGLAGQANIHCLVNATDQQHQAISEDTKNRPLLAFVKHQQAIVEQAASNPSPSPSHALAIPAHPPGPKGDDHTNNDLTRIFPLVEREPSALDNPHIFRWLSLREHSLDSDKRNLADGLHALGLSCLRKGLWVESEPIFKRSLGIRERLLDASHPELADSLHCLGLLYLQTGLYSQAEPLFARALAIRGRALPPDHADMADTMGRLAAVFAATGRYGRAESLYSHALAIYDKSADTGHPFRQETTETLAMLRAFRLNA